MKRTLGYTFSRLGKRFGNTIDTIAGQFGQALETGKSELYRTVARLENDIRNPQSTLGGLRQSLDTLIAQGKQYHEGVQKQGGYGSLASKNVDRALNTVDNYMEKVGSAVESYLERVDSTLQNRFYADGKVDEKKVEAFVNDQKTAIKEYGRKFVSKVTGALRDARAAIVEDYRRNIPTQQELTGKYAGVGTQYEGILTRNDYEGCLSFHNYAERTLPAGRAYRQQILADIKASASENLDELKTYYETVGEKDGKAEYKLKLVEELLRKKQSKKY